MKKAKQNEVIVIYRNGQEVIARDKATDCVASAKCSPEDEFNFYSGAKLAFERLMEKPFNFKIGDWVVGTKKANKYYVITREGWTGKIDKIEGKFIVVDGYRVKADCFMPCKPRGFTGKVVCVDAMTPLFIKGKIYEFKNGVGLDITWREISPKNFESVDDLNRCMCSKFIEIKE